MDEYHVAIFGKTVSSKFPLSPKEGTSDLIQQKKTGLLVGYKFMA
jgi:hypothetical protein